MNNKYNYSILFVEDDKTIRKNYVTGLKLMFNNVYEAENGIDGFKIYQEKKPHIMIVDIDLPQLNGIDMIKKIRDSDRKTQIIILTAHSDKNFLLDATALKLINYLIKPISKDKLLESLKQSVCELENYNIEAVKKIDLIDGFVWDKKRCELLQNNQKVLLTPKELKFLELLFSRTERIFTYEDIFSYVWDFDDEFSIHKIKSLVKKLRKKLPEELIENIYSIGFRINNK